MTEHKTILTEFIQKCSAKGLRVTPQRLTIYEALVKTNTHPNAEEIYRTIHEAHPTISLATVYKTLDTLEKHGLIATVSQVRDTTRYDSVTTPHHHMICVKCKRIFDLFDERLNSLEIPESVTRGNVFLNYSIHFHILCPDCQEKPQTSSS